MEPSDQYPWETQFRGREAEDDIDINTENEDNRNRDKARNYNVQPQLQYLSRIRRTFNFVSRYRWPITIAAGVLLGNIFITWPWINHIKSEIAKRDVIVTQSIDSNIKNKYYNKELAVKSFFSQKYKVYEFDDKDINIGIAALHTADNIRTNKHHSSFLRYIPIDLGVSFWSRYTVREIDYTQGPIVKHVECYDRQKKAESIYGDSTKDMIKVWEGGSLEAVLWPHQCTYRGIHAKVDKLNGKRSGDCLSWYVQHATFCYGIDQLDKADASTISVELIDSGPKERSESNGKSNGRVNAWPKDRALFRP